MPINFLFRGPVWRWAPFLVWCATILVLSLDPSPPRIDNRFLNWDKLQHASAYAVLALSGYHAFSGIADHKRRTIASMVVAIGFGSLMELFQGVFTINRQADYHDIAANAIGAFIACCSITLLKCRKHR